MGGPLRHADVGSDAELDKQARAHVESQPGVRFLVDVLTALHQIGAGLRNSTTFYDAFAPGMVLEALAQRPDLRVKVVQSLTGGPATLLRRVPPAELAHQIELLAAEDLPPQERSFRLESERTLTVQEIYMRRLDMFDIASYLPAPRLWQYEMRDGWWNQEPNPALRVLMAAELKSVRRHQLLPDSELLDIIGDEALERDLPLQVRIKLRTAARRAGAEGRPFKDSDVITSVRSADGLRDLIDDLSDHLPLPLLRRVINRAVEVLGIDNAAAGAAVAVSPPVEKTPGPRVTIAPLTTPAKPFAATPVTRGGKDKDAKGGKDGKDAKDKAPIQAVQPSNQNDKTPAPLLTRDGPTIVDRPPTAPSGQRPSTRPAAVTGKTDDPFGFGPPVEEDVLHGMDDFAAPDAIITVEESTENR